MDSLPSEVRHTIFKFAKNYWKPKFDEVIKQLIHENEFQCQLCWSSEECDNDECYDRIRYTNQSCYQDSYNKYLEYYVGYVNTDMTCNCIIISRNIISCFLEC